MSAPRQNWSACDKPMTHGSDCDCVCMLCLCFLKACSHGAAWRKAMDAYNAEIERAHDVDGTLIITEQGAR